MTAETLHITRDELEANARKHMARLSRFEVRGWDSQAVRNDELAVIDALLDAWLALG